MAENSKIEWTHHTGNLWHGCDEVHEGCNNCYARILSRRWGRDLWGNDKPRLEIKSVWRDLDRFQKNAAAEGVMKRVFVGSMMDIFEKPMPLIDSKGNVVGGEGQNTGCLRWDLFYRIDKGMYNNLLFLFLTKRPSNINKYIRETWKTNPPNNVMFGCSVVNQKTADNLIPQLLQVNGKRFLSMEPLLGPVEFSNVTNRSDSIKQLGKKALSGIDWVIVGGESGHYARPMHPDWARSIRDQCKAAGVPFFFKQWGEYAPGEFGRNYREKTIDFTDRTIMVHAGKKAAGRNLDGQIYNEFPTIL